ncbi:YraN family protein [Gynurincola endophyticus]|uniref:YraN family protein n=1 Tax=Gynurincola endophyticus TaxID=2479004 RepID=UPI0037435CD3
MIARKKEKFHFIEVKTRTDERFGYGLTNHKLQHLWAAIEAYIEDNNIDETIETDILLITGFEQQYTIQ